jgi:hypothetical protein
MFWITAFICFVPAAGSYSLELLAGLLHNFAAVLDFGPSIMVAVFLAASATQMAKSLTSSAMQSAPPSLRDGGFHRRIDGQQFGLKGDIVDGLGDLVTVSLLARSLAWMSSLSSLRCRPFLIDATASVVSDFACFGVVGIRRGLVIEEPSSIEANIFSKPEACAEATSASDWLAL